MANTPAISVVIPMYNAERYIGECLDSVLAQTFQDFEVILINDDSTDSSRQIVEGYLEKFDGRLKIYDHEKNFGVPVVRNRGLTLSRGEYIFFLDSDDMITKTALEEMYSLAKEFDADVVYCERFFKADNEGKNIEEKLSVGLKNVDKPNFESENLMERMNYILVMDVFGVVWNKFIRRDFLLENEIFFPNLVPCEDYIWSLELFFFAKRFLRVPNSVYIYRISKNSMTRAPLKRQQKTFFWLNAMIVGAKILDQIMDRLPFFQQNIPFRYAVLEKLSMHMFELTLSNANTLNVPQYYVYDSIKKKFGNKFGEQDVLVPLLCSLLDKYQKIIAEKDEKIAELEKKLNAK